MGTASIIKLILSLLTDKKSRGGLICAITVPFAIIAFLICLIPYFLNPFSSSSIDEIVNWEDDYTTLIAEIKDEKSIKNNIPDYVVRIISMSENMLKQPFGKKEAKKYIINNFVTKNNRFLEGGEIVNYIINKNAVDKEYFDTLVEHIDLTETEYLSAVASVPLVYGTSYTVSNNVATLTGNRHGKVISGIPGTVKEVSVNANKPSKSYVVIESEITTGVMLQLKYENLIYVKVKVNDEVNELDIIGFQGENNTESDKLKLTIKVNGEKRNPKDFLGEEVTNE